MITWSESTRPCPIITWYGLVIIGEHLHVDRIYHTTHARPFGLLCSEAMSVHMLGSSSQPKCFACVNLSYTRCMWTLESITPDHHVVLRNNELSQRCTVRGNTSLEIFSEGSSYLCYRRSKQIRCKHDKHHMQSNSDMIWPISFCSFDLHLRGTMIIFATGMTPWSPSLCLHEVVTPTITSTSMANCLATQ